MAFTDEVLAHSDATVAIVDRRHAPGGHWVDAYPYVRLHQPSTFYGVTSRPLGEDAIDTAGTNEGFYELAGADEIRSYYLRVMTRDFLPTGRVRYFPNCDYVGEHRFVSRLSDASWEARVRRKLVDATYLEGAIPGTSPPPFEVAEGVRCVAAGEIARIVDRPEHYVIIGGGKTALDACVWLLEGGVPPAAIRWIKPREAWWMNRRFQQPHALSPQYYRGIALQLQAMAEASSIDELFERLEADDVFLRVDPGVRPTMFRGAIVSESELRLLRQVEDVVRMGHVQRITPTEIVLEDGCVPTSTQALHIHCAARGLASPPARPIFEPGRVTLQPISWGFICYQYATQGVVEAAIDSDDEKNALCRSIRYWERNEDYLGAFQAAVIGDLTRSRHPSLTSWIKSTRLNPANSAAGHRDDPDLIQAKGDMRRHGPLALANLPRLLSDARPPPAA